MGCMEYINLISSDSKIFQLNLITNTLSECSTIEISDIHSKYKNVSFNPKLKDFISGFAQFVLAHEYLVKSSVS